MNADEIVKELRESCTGNEFAPPMVTNRELTEAADLIESLQAQLAEKIHIKLRTDEDILTPAEAIETINRLRKAYRKTIAQISASQRREKAAVEDIYKMTDGGECDICKHYNPDKNTCAKPFVPYDDCFEWRGPQDKKGVTE